MDQKHETWITSWLYLTDYLKETFIVFLIQVYLLSLISIW